MIKRQRLERLEAHVKCRAADEADRKHARHVELLRLATDGELCRIRELLRELCLSHELTRAERKELQQHYETLENRYAAQLAESS